MGEPQFITLEDGWENIEALALRPVQEYLNTGVKNFTSGNCMAALNIVVKMCSQRRPYLLTEELHQRHREWVTEYLSDVVLPSIREKGEEALLAELARRWKNHGVMDNWMDKTFHYLSQWKNKFYDHPKIVRFTLFRDIVFNDPRLKENVASVLLMLIERERSGTADFDADAIRSCVNLYKVMSKDSPVDYYTRDLELPLLEGTRTYYTRRVSEWIKENNTPSYLRLIERVYADERARAQRYFLATTEPMILEVLDCACLIEPLEQFMEREGSGCAVLLANEMFEDLQLMYQLVSRKSKSLDKMCDIFREHVKRLGFDRIEQRAAVLERLPEKEREKDSNGGAFDPQFVKVMITHLVGDLLALRDKYTNVVGTYFSDHHSLWRALHSAFTDIANRDLLGSKVTMPEVLATFCDRVLKAGAEKLSDEEIEEFIDKAAGLFNYLIEKDVFADIYRNQLAKRLLNQRSCSDDMEKLMVSKLKNACGVQFTSKMEGMLNDLAVAKEQHADFEIISREKIPNTEFNVSLLTMGNWPTYRVIDVNLPAEMDACCKLFSQYYASKASSRRLHWTFSLGNCQVRANYDRSRYHNLEVSTLQAAVLLYFNKKLSWSFVDLLAELKCPDDVLNKLLHPLVKMKVLLKSSEGSSMLPSDSFSVNKKFAFKLLNVRVPVVSLEEVAVAGKAEADRKHAIEAACVRIMKTRKVLSHQQLVGEVLSQLQFFQPTAAAIKRVIGDLIEREYLERDADNSTVYKYLA